MNTQLWREDRDGLGSTHDIEINNINLIPQKWVG